jgi:hypothetical protein
MAEKKDRLFREAFLQVLADKLPSWKVNIAESNAGDQPIQVCPSNWKGPPFRIYISSDTVSVFPLCDFGLDYISTARSEDLKQRPELVFCTGGVRRCRFRQRQNSSRYKAPQILSYESRLGCSILAPIRDRCSPPNGCLYSHLASVGRSALAQCLYHLM